MAADESWRKIFADYKIDQHDFQCEPFILTAAEIKHACQNYTKTTEKEVRILCKQDSRTQRPEIFQQRGLFILPIKNGKYALIEGEGYVDIPAINSEIINYQSQLTFPLDTTCVGNSEMQYLDYAYAASLIRHFADDESLVLTIRGRKYTPAFSFYVGKYKQQIKAKSVQTEVDAGYEGKDKILLIEAKNSMTTDVIIRQLYYPFRQWQHYTQKAVELLFFEKRADIYYLWRFGFERTDDYNSINLIDSARYKITALS